MYVHIFVCISHYVYLCACISCKLSYSCVQNGLMPLATKDYKDFPLTRANGDAPSPRVESFVVAITFLRCFNTALHNPENKIVMNWWNNLKDNKFVRGMRHVPPLH